MEMLKFSLPVSPAKFIDDSVKTASKLTVTYGNGGYLKTYYAITIKSINENELEIEDHKGEIIIINPRYVVEKRKVRVVKIVTDTTKHTNFYEEKVKQSILTEYHVIELTDKYFLDSGQVGGYKNLISKHTETESL